MATFEDTTTTSGNHQPSLLPRGPVSLVDAMSRSTIYQRHEARRLKTLALADDPRPAMIRVFSGLPGLRIIFKPYQQPVQSKMVIASSSIRPSITAVDEPTLFSLNDTFATTKPISDNVHDNHKNIFMSSVLASAMGAMLSQVLMGPPPGTTSSSTPRTKSPFSSSAAAANTVIKQQRLIPVMTHSTMTPFSILTTTMSSSSRSFFLAPVAVSMSSIASVSFVFGTNAFLQDRLTSFQVPQPIVVVSSAALAGTAHALLRHVMSSSSASLYAGQQVVAATTTTTCYFTMYHAVKESILYSLATTESNNNNKTNFSDSALGWKNHVAFLTAGAAAGMTRTWISQQQTTTSRSATTTTLLLHPKSCWTRPAMTHAILFWGYEMMRNALQ